MLISAILFQNFGAKCLVQSHPTRRLNSFPYCLGNECRKRNFHQNCSLEFQKRMKMRLASQVLFTTSKRCFVLCDSSCVKIACHPKVMSLRQIHMITTKKNNLDFLFIRSQSCSFYLYSFYKEILIGNAVISEIPFYLLFNH